MTETPLAELHRVTHFLLLAVAKTAMYEPGAGGRVSFYNISYFKNERKHRSRQRLDMRSES